MTPVTPGTWKRHGETNPVWPGRNWPLGATWSTESTNFAVYAPLATRVWVCTFDDDGREERHEVTERSLGVWHCALPRIVPGTCYGFRADGHRFIITGVCAACSRARSPRRRLDLI